jgi:cysteinyl-tRNA synthetase
VLARYDGETIRFLMLRTHYRSHFNFSDAHLDDAKSSLRRLYTALDAHAEVDSAPSPDWSDPRAGMFRDAMNDDFNTPIAVSVLFELAGELNRTGKPADARLLRSLGSVLGILQQPPRSFLQSGAGIDEASIAGLIEKRRAAKVAGDYSSADAIRKQLSDKGIALNDSAQGTTWVRA